MNYQLWRHGFIGGTADPYRCVQALIRSRAVDPDRAALLASIRAVVQTDVWSGR